jgi:hypothetical protein
MQRILILILLILLKKDSCSQKTLSNNSQGTWINLDYYDNLLKGSPENKLNKISPRLIFIDSLGDYQFEYRFEQMSKERLHPQIISDKDGNTILVLKYSSIRKVSDSLLQYQFTNPPKKVLFKKISNSYSCIPCGIQFYFRETFWKGKKKWSMTEYRDAQS